MIHRKDAEGAEKMCDMCDGAARGLSIHTEKMKAGGVATNRMNQS